MNKNSRLTNLTVCLAALCSFVALDFSLRSFRIADPRMFGVLLVLAVAASRLKVSLPRMEGSMSMKLPFILIAIAKLSTGEAIIIAGLSALAQCLPRGGTRMRPIQFFFNTCSLINAAALSGFAFQFARNLPTATGSLLVAAAAAAFLLADTIPVAIIIAVSEPADAWKTWRGIFTLTFPYFALSAGMSAVVIEASLYVGWYAVGVLPVMYGVYRSYRRYWSGLEYSKEQLTQLSLGRFAITPDNAATT